MSALVLLLGACSGTDEPGVDAASNDAGANDAGANDAGANDAGANDAGRDAATDADPGDAGSSCDPPCFEGVACGEVGDGYRCGACPPGLEGDGVACVEIDGCAADPCFAGVTCTDAPAPETGFTCGACPAGTEGDGVSCEDIDGCAAEPCFAGVTCTDAPAPEIGFACGACPSGLEGDGRDCTEIDGCAGDPCLNAACMDVPAPGTGHTCGTCAPGTSGPDCAVPDCVGPLYCAGPVSGAATTFTREVTSGTNFNVGLSHAVDTPNGAAVGYTASPCCIDGTGSAGVLFADATQRLVSVFSGASRAGTPPEPALSFDGSVLHLFDPFTDYATRRTVNPTSLALGSPASVSLTGVDRDSPPAVVPRPGGHMALLVQPGEGVQIRRFNAAFGAPVSTTLLGFPTAMPALSTTCGGNALGAWLGSATTNTLLTRAFNGQATPLNPAGSIPDAGPAYGHFLSRAYRVSFDGQFLVVAVQDAVLELRADGSLARRTPVTGVLAAAGTSDGLLVVRRDATSGDGAPVELVERETGAVVRELARIPTGGYAADAAVAIHQDATGASVHFFATSFATRSNIVGATIRCR